MVRLPDLDGTSDLQRYTSCARPGAQGTDFTMDSPSQYSLDALSWPMQQSLSADRSSTVCRPSLPPLHLPSMSFNSNSMSSVKNTYGHISSLPTSAAYSNATAYSSSRPTTPRAGTSNAKSPANVSLMMTDSPVSSIDEGYNTSHLSSMGVRDGRIKKASPRCASRRLPASKRELIISRFASPSIPLENEASLGEPHFDNRKAGKERNAREDIRTQMEKHYRELLAAGPDYQPVTRLNKHNSDVARIPCKKEEVLDLSFRLHQVRKNEIQELRQALRSVGSKLHRKSSLEDLNEVRTMIKQALGEAVYIPTQRIPVSKLYAPDTPEATPSPEYTLCFSTSE